MPKTRKLFRFEGKYYRMRRGIMVEIPPEWVGVGPTRETMRQRKDRKAQMKKFTGQRIHIREKIQEKDFQEEVMSSCGGMADPLG